MRILDAGCGGGRNAEFLMRNGADVHGVDADPARIATIRKLAAQVAPALPAEHFTVSRLTELSFPDGHFGAVICNAVLHFAEDENEFTGMLTEMWRVLAPGGIFFARLASTIGIESLVKQREGRWYHLPDGSDRFLVDEPMLTDLGHALGATLVDPLKTTVVHGLRSMTTWVLRKP